MLNMLNICLLTYCVKFSVQELHFACNGKAENACLTTLTANFGLPAVVRTALVCTAGVSMCWTPTGKGKVKEGSITSVPAA